MSNRQLWAAFYFFPYDDLDVLAVDFKSEIMILSVLMINRLPLLILPIAIFFGVVCGSAADLYQNGKVSIIEQHVNSCEGVLTTVLIMSQDEDSFDDESDDDWIPKEDINIGFQFSSGRNGSQLSRPLCPALDKLSPPPKKA